jgi:phage terminase large subunit-like protein
MWTGENPQKLISTAPKPTLLLKAIVNDPGTVITRIDVYCGLAASCAASHVDGAPCAPA